MSIRKSRRQFLKEATFLGTGIITSSLLLSNNNFLKKVHANDELSLKSKVILAKNKKSPFLFKRLHSMEYRLIILLFMRIVHERPTLKFVKILLKTVAKNFNDSIILSIFIMDGIFLLKGHRLHEVL